MSAFVALKNPNTSVSTALLKCSCVISYRYSCGTTGRTRPVCAYPQTAIYNGRGSIDDAASFHCGGNVEKRAVVCADVLVKYKQEVNGGLSFRGSGVDEEFCRRDDPAVGQLRGLPSKDG
jgi:hypothetical protein